jgi:hypothetical protein
VLLGLGRGAAYGRTAGTAAQPHPADLSAAFRFPR